VKDGQFYVVFPPFPAILLMPFVFLFGTGFRTLLITPVLGAMTALFAYRLALKNGVSRHVARWVTLGLVFGTSLLLCIREPIDTYFAHCCAVLLATIALNEAFGSRRGVLIGFALGFAVLSRQLTVFTIPFVWAVLLTSPSDERTSDTGLRAVVATGIGLAICAGFYLYLNWIRFGDPLDPGYGHLVETGWHRYRAERWGNFHWVYIPSNLIRMFLSGFHIQFLGPSLLIPRMSPLGTSLTFASPFVFYAFRGRITRAPRSNVIGWACIAVTCLVALSYKSALGAAQVNAVRYTLDFMPMLFIFIALGLERSRGTVYEWLAKRLIVYSIALNLIALILIPIVSRALERLPH
jgi:4-amino-4-deoxy-L-arabinose transferase-like glycosyltransferase